MADAATFRVFGRVQGVGFRAFVQRTAAGLGLVGFVRNETDGSVSGTARGERAALDALHDALRRGPAWANVERVAWDENAAEGGAHYDRFDVRR